jgi:hypothetical protein
MGAVGGCPGQELLAHTTDRAEAAGDGVTRLGAEAFG